MSFDPDGDVPPHEAEEIDHEGEGALTRLLAGPRTVVVNFEGRMPRFLYFCGLLLVLGWLVLAISTGTRVADNHFPYCGIAIILVGLFTTIWGGLAFTIARLHDLGMSGAHAVWIYGLLWGCGAISSFSVEEVVCAVWGMALGTAVFLLFVPGQREDNRWGRYRGRRRRTADRTAK